MPEQIEFQPELISDFVWGFFGELEEFEENSDEKAEELYEAITECESWKECNALLRKRELNGMAEAIEDWLEDLIVTQEAERKEQELKDRAKAKEDAIENDAKRTVQMNLF